MLWWAVKNMLQTKEKILSLSKEIAGFRKETEGKEESDGNSNSKEYNKQNL